MTETDVLTEDKSEKNPLNIQIENPTGKLQILSSDDEQEGAVNEIEKGKVKRKKKKKQQKQLDYSGKICLLFVFLASLNCCRVF